eukprot:TRINITY_DN5160_c0_g1_i1.p1 TRINITY_DN5160_c0_g1~~TRINITY_DN5160_c0_g1_i1.p1  ORF type:complete len:442 (+),score=107.29 TRINITY_DN5160_c0_g1_i1:67-1392(+)
MSRLIALLAVCGAAAGMDLTLGVPAVADVPDDGRAFLLQYEGTEPLAIVAGQDCAGEEGASMTECLADPCHGLSLTVEMLDNEQAYIVTGDSCRVFLSVAELPTDNVYTIRLSWAGGAAPENARNARVVAYIVESGEDPEPEQKLGVGFARGDVFLAGTATTPTATLATYSVDVPTEHIVQVHVVAPRKAADFDLDVAPTTGNAHKLNDAGEFAVQGQALVAVETLLSPEAFGCPWLAAGRPASGMLCGNGTTCDADGCCKDAGGVKACAQNMELCSEPHACGGDHCCAASCAALAPRQARRVCGVTFMLELREAPQHEEEEDGGMSGGGVFLLLLFVACMVYCTVGIAYNCYRGSGGFPDFIPHLNFWREVPSFFAEGVRVAKRKLCGGKEETPNYSAYRGEYSPAPRDAMGQSAGSSAYADVRGDDDSDGPHAGTPPPL